MRTVSQLSKAGGLQRACVGAAPRPACAPLRAAAAGFCMHMTTPMLGRISSSVASPGAIVPSRSVRAASGTGALAQTFTLPDRSLMVTSITAGTVDAFLKEMDEASATGVDVLELRLDFIKDYDTERDLRRIMKHCKLPYIVTYRPTWEWWVTHARLHACMHTKSDRCRLQGPIRGRRGPPPRNP